MGRHKLSKRDLEFRVEVATKFRAAMNDRGLSEVDAARALGISRQAFNQYLHKKTTPEGGILARACMKWDLKLKYRNAEFARGAFGVEESRVEPEVLQMDLFREPQVFENDDLVVQIQRSQKATLQVTIKMKKAAAPSRGVAKKAS